MLPLRLLLGFALRQLLANRDAEQRDELIGLLWAPEGGWDAITERAMLRAASVIPGVDQVDELDGRVVEGEVIARGATRDSV